MTTISMAQQTVDLVAAFCSIPSPSVTVDAASKQPTTTVAGGACTGLITICKALVSQSPKTSLLLGSSPEHEAQVNNDT